VEWLEVGGLEVGGLEVGGLEVEAGGLEVGELWEWPAISIIPVTATDVSKDGTLPG